MLYVPEGCPHRVDNLETSIAISANYVDLSNFAEVKSHLKVNALMDPRAKNLLDQMSNPSFPAKMDSKLDDIIPWRLFKEGNANCDSCDYWLYQNPSLQSVQIFMWNTFWRLDMFCIFVLFSHINNLSNMHPRDITTSGTKKLLLSSNAEISF